MVTSGPLLPEPGAVHVEVEYLCPICVEFGRQADVHIWFGPADVVPDWMDLPCFGCAPLLATVFGHVSLRRHLRADLVRPPAKQ